MIEQVARAMFTAFSRGDLSWDDIPEVVQEGYREMAAAAVEVYQPVLDSWIQVAESRQQLIDTLKAEKRQLQHELARFTED